MDKSTESNIARNRVKPNCLWDWKAECKMEGWNGWKGGNGTNERFYAGK